MKTRFSISLDEARAARIKAAAALAGQDVSSYMGKAALALVEREEQVAATFAEIDRRIANSEALAPTLSWPPPSADGQLEVKEEAQIQLKWDALLGAALPRAA
ncbi:MAG: hypothetical protein DLM55_01250 [Acidimicrobiales bacterium]|nr:MAG: hypothetical protein DLM55_01250 [Acidimicrobiales bacterium]